MKKIFMVLAAAFIAVFAAAGLDSLFYQPTSKLHRTPASDGFAFEAVEFDSADGTKLSGWFIPAKGDALGTVVHFHGNAQNMSAHYSFVSWLPANGFNLFVFDYRGYGDSEGTPSRRGVYEDSVAALNHVESRTDIDQRKIIVFGQSIGGANAIAAVGNNDFKGVVGVASESAFSTYKSVAAEHAGLLKPFAYLLIGNKFSPKKSVGQIAPIPILILHGTEDRVASFKHAERLHEAASEPKELWTIEGAGHTAALGPLRAEYAPRLHAKFVEWVTRPETD